MKANAATAKTRIRMPLSPISQPQLPRQKAPSLPTREDGPLDNEQSSFPFTEENDACKLEVMQVNITIYGLSGIVSRVEEKSKRARHLPRVSKNKKKKKALTSLQPVEIDGPWSSSRTASSDQTYPRDAPPTTAVISCRRNVTHSGTEIDTFLPSLPLQPSPSFLENATRYLASWPNDYEGSPLMEMDQVDQSTFKMIRLMKPESYRPDTNIGLVSNYSRQTIDLRICLGRGKELVPLGIASLAIAGDEEGEVIMNVPAKPLGLDSAREDSFRPAGKKQSKKAVFSHDPRRVYTLDENAILQVGVRVLPQKAIKEAKERATKDRARQERFLADVLDGFVDEKHVLELSDENSLIEKYVASRRKKIEEEEAEAERNKASLQTPLAAILPQFFCGALDIFSPTTFQREEAAVPEEVSTVESKKEQAVVHSLSLMSSVSESVSTDVSRDFEFQVEL